jgi:multicomponent Na+:H+ antiporter subunit G
MNPVTSVLLVLGALVALLAGIGLLTFTTPYARFHAAGKASPIAFLLVAIGAGIEVGLRGAAELAIVAVALLLTLPASTHLLFRATHRTTDSEHLSVDALAAPERELAEVEAHAADIAEGDADDHRSDPTPQ